MAPSDEHGFRFLFGFFGYIVIGIIAALTFLLGWWAAVIPFAIVAFLGGMYLLGWGVIAVIEIFLGEDV